MKKITGLFIAGGLLLILLFTIGHRAVQGKTEVEVLKSHEEFANALLSDGLSKEEVELIIEFDKQVETAHKNGASREELVEMTFEMNEKMDQTAQKDMGKTVSASAGSSQAMGTSYAGIYATCDVGVTARWFTEQGFWSSYFRESNGNYYRHSGTCDYSYCGLIKGARRDYAYWEYHLAVGHGYPFHTHAGCKP